MDLLRSLYHRVVPASVRNPFGMARRKAWEHFQRMRSADPIPEQPMLLRLQPDASAARYLSVGVLAAGAVRSEMAAAGHPAGARRQMLDFGCGPARVLRHLRDTAWELHGCDVDREVIEWATAAFPAIDFVATEPAPPLPYPDGAFDFVIAISVFPHLGREEHEAWSIELARVIARGGHLMLTTVGADAARAFTGSLSPEMCEELRARGFADGVRTAPSVHTPAGIARLFAPELELIRWNERGLGSFEDVAVLRRRS